MMPWGISGGAARQVDWPTVDDLFGTLSTDVRKGALEQTPKGKAAQEQPQEDPVLSEADRERARTALSELRQSFEQALGWLRRTMRLVVGGILLCVGVAVASGALAVVHPALGVVSLASVGGVLVLLRRSWTLAKDQALLELVPARFQLAIELCRTQRDLNLVSERFLNETSAARGAEESPSLTSPTGKRKGTK